MDDQDTTGRASDRDSEDHDDVAATTQPQHEESGDDLADALVAFLRRISPRAVRPHPHDR